MTSTASFVGVSGSLISFTVTRRHFLNRTLLFYLVILLHVGLADIAVNSQRLHSCHLINFDINTLPLTNSTIENCCCKVGHTVDTVDW